MTASPDSREERPLLDDNQQRSEQEATPLPVEQLLILFLLRFCESASTFCIFPFLEELLKSVIKGGEEQVGYYAGLMDMIRHSISLVTVLYWSRVSDKIGRKPPLLLGIASLSVSMISFGLSKSFWALVVSRCIFTAFNSNAGIIKSIIGEITDTTNSASAFALLHVPWAAGSSFGAFVGGWLAGPSFSKQYPYFLPCATTGILSFIAFIITAARLRESLPRRPRSRGESHDPAALKELVTTAKVMIPLLNYSSLAFLHTCSNTILPLYLALPIEMGGLGLPPASIGIILSIYGAANATFQAVFLGLLVRRFGAKQVFISAIVASIPLYTMYIVNSLFTKASGQTTVYTYLFIIVQMAFSLVIECGYGCIYMFITSAAPNRQSLGSTNGIAQTMVSVVRMVSAPFAGSLLSYSIQVQWAYGYGVYLVMIALGLFCSLLLARKLPDELS